MTGDTRLQPTTDSAELLGNLPLRYIDGPDYCTVKDATDGDFALTLQPELMQLMEQAALEAAALKARVAELEEALKFYRDSWASKTHKNRPGIEWYAKPNLLDDCGEKARATLQRKTGS